MRPHLSMWMLIVCLLAGGTSPAAAEIVYRTLNILIPLGDSVNVDVDQDGITDVTFRSSYLQDYCQFGDGNIWTLSVSPAAGGGLMTGSGHVGSNYVAALQANTPVNAGQSFYPDFSIMAQLSWGQCGTGTLGEWLNLPDRYLGMGFRDGAGNTHFGWVKASTAAYVDGFGHLHAVVRIASLAYETGIGGGILTGQISEGR